MKLIVVLFVVIISIVSAAPQFGFGGSSSNALANSQSFGVGFGPLSFSGSSAQASAGSNSFGGPFGGFSGSSANAQSSSSSFGGSPWFG